MRQYEIDNNDRKAYPLGLTNIKGGIHVSVAAAAKSCSLLLFAPSAAEPVRIPFPEENRVGDVWGMTVLGKGLERYTYAFEADGKPFSDPYGKAFTGRDQWGVKALAQTLLRTPVRQEDFDWEGDRPLQTPYEDCIIYRAHVRGFTRHASSRVKDKGTFRGIEEKIPHMKELGVTTLELMPAAEFPEITVPEYVEGHPYGQEGADSRLNYWGYGPAFHSAPKAAYAGRKRSPVLELKHLVKELHQAGIELVVELYFTGGEDLAYVLDMVRRWVVEYHVDGIHLSGTAPLQLLAKDPYLACTKLWASSWEGVKTAEGAPKRLAEYNDGFLVDMRRVLKGDEGQMNNLAARSRRNPDSWAVVNYMAGSNGFTLMDMVSYEQKHNEDNGEDNQDGSDYNFTWNCGVEGPARKKKVVELRRRQLRNALLLLFLSQGTPMLLAGDEFGNSQNGNNNAYCQDNGVSWLNWSQLETNKDLFDFAKKAIAFRKAHPVFHKKAQPRMMDYLACGYPDVSYHGIKACVPEFDNFRRQLGILYCGAYEKKSDGSPDDTFYVAYNMHWEPHEFALPHLRKGMEWHIVFDTSDGGNNGYYEPGQEPASGSQKQVMVPSRSIMVFVGKKVDRAARGLQKNIVKEVTSDMPEDMVLGKPGEDGREEEAFGNQKGGVREEAVSGGPHEAAPNGAVAKPGEEAPKSQEA